MTVASLATTTHSRPLTLPTPVMIPAPGASSSYMPNAASGDSSRKGLPAVEQGVDPLTRQQLAALHMADAGRLRAAGGRRQPVAQLVHRSSLDRHVPLEGVAVAVDNGCATAPRDPPSPYLS